MYSEATSSWVSWCSLARLSGTPVFVEAQMHCDDTAVQWRWGSRPKCGVAVIEPEMCYAKHVYQLFPLHLLQQITPIPHECFPVPAGPCLQNLLASLPPIPPCPLCPVCHLLSNQHQEWAHLLLWTPFASIALFAAITLYV